MGGMARVQHEVAAPLGAALTASFLASLAIFAKSPPAAAAPPPLPAFSGLGLDSGSATLPPPLPPFAPLANTATSGRCLRSRGDHVVAAGRPPHSYHALAAADKGFAC